MCRNMCIYTFTSTHLNPYQLYIYIYIYMYACISPIYIYIYIYLHIYEPTLIYLNKCETLNSWRTLYIYKCCI